MQSLEASNAEIERLKATCAQTQSKLETSQQDLAQSRQEMQQAREELIEQSEKARKKELELQSDLVAYKRSIAELEVYIRSFIQDLFPRGGGGGATGFQRKKCIVN